MDGIYGKLEKEIKHYKMFGKKFRIKCQSAKKSFISFSGVARGRVWDIRFQVTQVTNLT